LERLFEKRSLSPKFNVLADKDKPDDQILNLVLNDGDTNSLERYKEKKKTVKRSKTKKFEPVLQAKKVQKLNKVESGEYKKRILNSVSPSKFMSKQKLSKSPDRKLPIHDRLYTETLKKCEPPSPVVCVEKPDCILENYNVKNRMLIFKKIEEPPSSSNLSFTQTLRVPRVTDWKCSSKGSSASKSAASKSDFSPTNGSYMRTPKRSIYNQQEDSFTLVASGGK
jgi:hypothetical protein